MASGLGPSQNSDFLYEELIISTGWDFNWMRIPRNGPGKPLRWVQKCSIQRGFQLN